VTTPNRFDVLAASWDDDPVKVARAAEAANALRARIPVVRSGWKALELGAGTGLLSRALAPDLGPITLVDTSEGMTAQAASKVAAATPHDVTAWCGDLRDPGAPIGPYELAYSMLALHHIDDVAGTLRAVHDALQPGGWVCMIDLDEDPGGDFHRAAVPDGHAHHGHTDHDADHGHRGHHAAHHETVEHAHDGFSVDALSAHLAAAGFVDVTVTDAGFTIDRGEPPRRFGVVCGVGRRASAG
jgi:SAM-dependent methyltransferase